ncbi:hypothetical protein [Clostridium beijerinckii]|uniref:Uncharacterized protein n=1 Tax=Clostridium beijerinckii TaxID=1520 RepID=A0A1S9N8Q6_CLOBE|nr:hypothetical protein [Clostridium beijerinckii]OOP73852.1 hypothetical protein CBEIBR21_04975 [Clostridium beijerinckii]
MAKAKYEVVDSIDSVDIKNETTPGAVLIRINDSLSDLGVTAQFKEFTITPSTTNSEGNLYSKVELSKDGNSTEVRYKKYIDELDDTNQTMAELAKVIENRMEHLNVNNDYTSENILNRLKHSVENPNLYLTLDNLDITKSTLDTEGKATGTIVIHKDGSTETQSVSFNIVIDKELTDEDEELINDVDNILSDYSYTKYKGSNNTTADQIKSEIENGLSDENIRVAVSDFELEAATDEWGYIDCKITLTRADNSVVTCMDGLIYTHYLVAIQHQVILQEIQVTQAHQAAQVHHIITHLVVQVLRQIAQVHQTAQILTQQLQQELQIQQMALHQIHLNQYH